MVARVEPLLEKYRVKKPEEMSQEELVAYEYQQQISKESYDEKIQAIKGEIDNYINQYKDDPNLSEEENAAQRKNLGYEKYENLTESQRYSLANQIYQKRFGKKFQLFLDEHPNFKDQPELNGWSQFTFEEILQMESNGVCIPKEVLDWAHSMQDSDNTDYIAEDADTLSFDADDSEMVKMQKKTIALNKEAKEKEAEITEKENRLKELTTEAENIKREQEDNTKNSLKQIQDLTQEWNSLSEKSKNGELSDSESARIKELGTLLNGEDGKLTVEVQASSADMQDLMNLMDGLSVDIEKGIDIGQDTIQIAKEISTEESFYHPKMIDDVANMVVNSAQGDVLDAKGQNLSINAMEQGNKLLEYSNTLNNELMMGQYKAIYDFAKMFTNDASETLHNTQEAMGDAWGKSSEEFESDENAESQEAPAEEDTTINSALLKKMKKDGIGIIQAVREAGKESEEIEESILEKIEELKSEKEDVEQDIEEAEATSEQETTEEIEEAAEEGDIESLEEAVEEAPAEGEEAVEGVADAEAAELDTEIEETNEDSLSIDELIESYMETNSEYNELNKEAQGIMTASVVTGYTAVGLGTAGIVVGAELISIGTPLLGFWMTAPVGAALVAEGIQYVVMGSMLNAEGTALLVTGGVGLAATVETGEQVEQTDETLEASVEEIEMIENGETEEEEVEESAEDGSLEEEGVNGEGEGEDVEEIIEEEVSVDDETTDTENKTEETPSEAVEEVVEEAVEEEGNEEITEGENAGSKGKAADDEDMSSDDAKKEGTSSAQKGKEGIKQGEDQTKATNKISKEMKSEGKESEKLGKKAQKTEKRLKVEQRTAQKDIDKAQKEIEKLAKDSAEAMQEEDLLNAENASLGSANEIAGAAIEAKKSKAAHAPQQKQTPGLLGGGNQGPNIQQEIVIVAANQGRMNAISERFTQLNARINNNKTSIIKLQGTVTTRLRKFEKTSKEIAKLQKEQQKLEQAKLKRIAQQQAIVGIINNVFSIINVIGTVIKAVSTFIKGVCLAIIITAINLAAVTFGASLSAIPPALNVIFNVCEAVLDRVADIIQKVAAVGTALCAVAKGIIAIANGQTLAGILAIGMAAVQAVMTFVGAGQGAEQINSLAGAAAGSIIGGTLQLAGAGLNMASTAMEMQNNIAVAKGGDLDPKLAEKSQMLGLLGGLFNAAGSASESIGNAAGGIKGAAKGAAKKLSAAASKKVAGSVLSLAGSATTTAAQLISMNKKGKGGVLDAALNFVGGVLGSVGAATGTGASAQEIAGTVFDVVGTTIASSANLSRAVKKSRGEKENHGETILEATGNALSAVGGFTKALPGGKASEMTAAQKAQLSGSVIKLAGTAISTAGIITTAMDGKKSEKGAILSMVGNGLSFAGQSISTLSGVAQGLKSSTSSEGGKNQSPYSKAEAAGAIIALLGQAVTMSSQMSTSIKAMNGEKANAFDEYLAAAGAGLSVVGNMTSAFGKLAETVKAEKKNGESEGESASQPKKTREERRAERKQRREDKKAQRQEELKKPLAERIKEQQEARAQKREERQKLMAAKKEERQQARAIRREERQDQRLKVKEGLKATHEMVKDYRAVKKSTKAYLKSNGTDKALEEKMLGDSKAFNDTYKAFIPDDIVSKINNNAEKTVEQYAKDIADGKLSLADVSKMAGKNIMGDAEFVKAMINGYRAKSNEAIEARVAAVKNLQELAEELKPENEEEIKPAKETKEEANKKKQEQQEKIEKSLKITAAVVQEATNIAKVAFQIAEVIEQDKHHTTQEQRHAADINLAALKRSRALVRTITRKHGAESRHSHYNRKA